MSTVAVNTDSLRESGAGLVTAREEFADSEYAKQLKGMGDYTRLSPGQFPPGVAADKRLTAHHTRMMEVFGTLQINLMALSSALHILADVYEEGDHADALRFAFAQTGVDAPDGLPIWFNTEQTFQDLQEEPPQDEDEDEEGTGAEVVDPSAYTAMPADYTRNTVYVPPVYAGGEVVQPGHEITIIRNGDDVVSMQYEVWHPDGSTEYYTVTPQDEGDPVISDRMKFGPQGRPVDYGDVMDWQRAEGNAFEEDPVRYPALDGS